MTWQAVDVAPDTTLIQENDRVVGSIQHIGRWQVEILWSGGGGDITGEFYTKSEALAFVSGVEKGWIAITWGRLHPSTSPSLPSTVPSTP
jgi:hypothetical protein